MRYALEVAPDAKLTKVPDNASTAVAAGVQMPPQALRVLDTASIAAVPDALKSLGLKLTPRKAPLDVLVIDSIEKSPTEN
jgi:uncharacterized protein (TIGR03435 family)